MNESINRVIVGYIRVSSERQKDNNSVKSQERLICEYVKNNQISGKIIYVIDNGKSGTSIHREGMQEVLSLIDSGEAKVIIAVHTDRLHRNTIDSLEFMNKCVEKNIRVVDLSSGIVQFEAPSEKMAFSMKAVVNESYSNEISYKTSAAIKQMAIDGKYPFGGKVPFGYRKDKYMKLHIVEHEVKMIKDLFYKYAYELKTEYEITRIALTKYDYKIAKSNVTKLLVKNLYWGYVEFAGERFKIVDPILTNDDFNQLQNRGFKNCFSKHDYKYRNKVYINGRLAKHQTKLKQDNIYKYYYLRGLPYIEERTIDKFLIQNKFDINEKGLCSIEEKVTSLVKALLYENIEYTQFEDKLNNYRREIKVNEQRLNRIDIQVGEVGIFNITIT